MTSDSSANPASHPRIGPFYVTQGIHNLRDYGGYATAAGGQTIPPPIEAEWLPKALKR